MEYIVSQAVACVMSQGKRNAKNLEIACDLRLLVMAHEGNHASLLGNTR